MGTSRTSKKQRPTNKKLLARAQEQATQEAMKEVLYRLLNHWGLKELDKFSINTNFVCLQTGKNTYRVGRFNLQKQLENSWVVTDLYDQFISDFYNKQAAVFYCLFETRHMYTRAAELRSSDFELGRAEQELVQLTQHLHTATRKKDPFACDLYHARLSNIRPKVEQLQSNLQKTIIRAKYSKVWETKS